MTAENRDKVLEKGATIACAPSPIVSATIIVTRARDIQSSKTLIPETKDSIAIGQSPL